MSDEKGYRIAAAVRLGVTVVKLGVAMPFSKGLLAPNEPFI